MQTSPFHLNLLSAWLGILLGFLSGVIFGLFFHREDWLGGYGSFQRRMYRLGHISFFGLAVVNFMFYLTAQFTAPASAIVHTASSALIIGAITMPVCCLLMAHFPRTRMLFSIPVFSLLLGCLLTIASLFHPSAPTHSGTRQNQSGVQTPQDTEKESAYLSFPSVELSEFAERTFAKDEP